MTFNPRLLIGTLLIISLLSGLVMGYDKQQARHNRWRVPEKTLWLLTVCGGATGSWIGMKLFHHKNQKLQFRFGIPFFALVQWGIIIYLLILK